MRALRHLLAASLLLAGLLVHAQPDMAAVRRDYAALVQVRDALARELAARGPADAAKYRLTLEGAADRDDLQLVLPWRDGKLAGGYADVPGWEQATMQEWRGFFLANGAGADWRPRLRYPVDGTGLARTAAGLKGAATAHLRLDASKDERMRPGTYINWWDRFITPGFTRPWTQIMALDARVLPNVVRCQLVLDGGIHWPPADANGGPANARRAPLVVELQAPDARWSRVIASTPNWCGGYHEGDASGLTLTREEDGWRIAGPLHIWIHQDGWMPRGGGKNPQMPPIPVRYVLDLRLSGAAVTGTFTADGEMGAFAGMVRGQYGQAVWGRYTADGPGGARAGAIRGMLVTSAPVPAFDAMVLPADDGAALARVAATVDQVLLETRALHLALRVPHLSYADALEQSSVAAPVWPADGKADAAALTAYLRDAARAVGALPRPDAPLPTAHPVGSFSPSLGTTPLIGGALPEDAKGWQTVTGWQVLGPFEQRLGIEHDEALAPEIIARPGLTYRQARDRFGCARVETGAAWQSAVVAGPRIAAPWEKPGMYTRFAGQVWYASATVTTAKARRIWIAIEAADQAKLWVNDRLVWRNGERAFRYRPHGAQVVAVDLEAGENRLLARVHRDRREAWLRVALTAENPFAVREEPRVKPTAPYADAYVVPDATPPLAWDIDKGINVAWRRADLGGSARPATAGDCLLLTRAPHDLICLDAATGVTRWTREASILELADAKLLEVWAAADPAKRLQMLLAVKDAGLTARDTLAGIRACEPITDGATVWMHAGTGVAAAYTLDGTRRWMVRTQLGGARLYRSGDLLVIEGQANPAWPVPEAMRPKPDSKGRVAVVPFVGVLALNARTGEERGRWTVPGAFEPAAGVLLTLPDAAPALLTSTSALIDLATPGRMGAIDAELPGPDDASYRASVQVIGSKPGRPFGVCRNYEQVFMTAEEQGFALDLWPGRDGRIAYGHRWESNYEHGGFLSFQAPCVANDRYLFSINPVLERGPHCSDPRLEAFAVDVTTGRVCTRLKPALTAAVTHYVNPAIAGRYVFFGDLGGGTHGGNATHGQWAIATADDTLQLICRNLVDLGTRTPVFAGDRMFLRSPRALTCIAVTTPEGRAYQARRLAETLFEEIGERPEVPAAKEAGAPGVPESHDLPVNPFISGRTPAFWWGMGPLTGDPAPNTLSAVSRQHAYMDPPIYRRQGSLQGTGDIVPFFTSWLDPRASASEQGKGVFVAIIDSGEDRYVSVPDLGAGVTQRINAVDVAPGDIVHLAPGPHTYRVTVAPAHFQAKAGGEVRLQAALTEVPNPAVRLAQWKARVLAREARLRDVMAALPGSAEAARVGEMLK